MDNKSGLSFMCGMLCGATVGAVLALLFAPQSGEETRAQLREHGEKFYKDAEVKVKEFAENAPKAINDAVEQGKKAIEEGKKNIEEGISKTRERIGQLKSDNARN